MAESSQVEELLRAALVPVEPPQGLTDRLERRLSAVAGSAADELAETELAAMRDPRNWVRPAIAVLVGGVAGSALIVVRARQRQKRRRIAAPTKAMPKKLRSAEQGVRKRLGH